MTGASELRATALQSIVIPGGYRESLVVSDEALNGKAEMVALRRHLEALARNVDDVRQSEEFGRFMDAMACFWRYSPFNQWMIRQQLPTAVRVAGQRTWERLGRRLLPDVKPIVILARTRKGFVPVLVYDISQTAGAPLPVLDVVVEGETDRVACLERGAERLGVRVVDLEGRLDLVGASVGGEIRIRAGLSSMERAATLAHELAHELLHMGRGGAGRGERLSVAEKETEAEATAYVVLKALGLPSKAPAYIAWQGGSGELIYQAMSRVQRGERSILEAATR